MKTLHSLSKHFDGKLDELRGEVEKLKGNSVKGQLIKTKGKIKQFVTNPSVNLDHRRIK